MCKTYEENFTQYLYFININQLWIFPIYMEKNNVDYNINISKVDGDTEINQFISKIKKYSGQNHNKKYDISINSEFSKISLAKDIL